MIFVMQTEEANSPWQPVISTGTNLPELSVSELSFAIKRTMEGAFALVRVRGEISAFKRVASGHVYFTLKDADTTIDSVLWKATAGRLSFRPEDGMEVICTGKVTTYAGRSKYQLIVERMEPAGVGALMALLEERKKKLAALGLFDPARKKKIPYLPRSIGVITSPTGAVIRDILHRLEERFPRPVLVYPVLVQGVEAAQQIANAIDQMNRLSLDGNPARPDVLIVARGGGSIEDLWPFNEEIVVQAVARSQIPVISAVGHETDTTLIDYVSDLRAPTPTAAAEFAVPVRSQLVEQSEGLALRLKSASRRLIEERRNRLQDLARGLKNPAEILAFKQQRVDDLFEHFTQAIRLQIEAKRANFLRIEGRLSPSLLQRDLQRLAQSSQNLEKRLLPALRHLLQRWSDQLNLNVRMLESVSYHRVLERGFALVRDHRGQVVASTSQLSAGEMIRIDLSDGGIDARVVGDVPFDENVVKVTKPTKAPSRNDKPAKETQGRLF